MIQRPRVALWAAQLILVLLALSATAQSEDDLLANWMIERFQDSAALEVDRLLAVDNPHGDIRFRGTEDGTVEVRAVIQHHEDDPLRAEIELVETEDGLQVDVRWVELAEGEDDGGGTPSAEMKRRRVDLSVFVPVGVRLEARTDSGLLEGKGLQSSADVATETGPIVFSTAGQVRARSQHGDVKVVFQEAGWTEPSEVVTVNGAIELWLPPDAALAFEGETRGVLSTDWSVEVGPPAERTGVKPISATLGAGGRVLRARSINGDVKLFRSRR